MTNEMKGVNRAIATAKAVAKKSTRVFAEALPIVSVGTTLWSAYQDSAGEPVATLKRITQRFTGVSPDTGQFSGEQFMKGSGMLLISAAASWALKQLI